MGTPRVASELTVAILPLGQISDCQITLTADVLEQEFGVKTMLMEPMEIPLSCFDKENEYCLADRALIFLVLCMPIEAQRIVGIADVELFAKEKLYTGRAWIHGGAALYSTAQITKKWAKHPERKLMCDVQSVIVTIHEFSHTFGLNHCANSKCIMDKTGRADTLCPDCQRWVDRELRVKPESAEVHFARAETLYALANLLKSASICQQAAGLYKQAIALAKNEPHYHHRLAYALAKCEQKEEAKRAQTLAGVLCKGYPDFDYLYALNSLEKNPDEAEKLFAKAVEAAKDKTHAHKIIGNAYREIVHNVDKALHHYRQYFQLGGDDQTIVEWYNSRLRGEVKS